MLARGGDNWEVGEEFLDARSGEERRSVRSGRPYSPAGGKELDVNLRGGRDYSLRREISSDSAMWSASTARSGHIPSRPL